MACRLIGPAVLWTRFIEHLFQADRSFTLVKRLLEVLVALTMVVPGVGVCHQF